METFRKVLSTCILKFRQRHSIFFKCFWHVFLNNDLYIENFRRFEYYFHLGCIYE